MTITTTACIGIAPPLSFPWTNKNTIQYKQILQILSFRDRSGRRVISIMDGT